MRCGQPAAALEVPHTLAKYVCGGGGGGVWRSDSLLHLGFSSDAMFGDEVVARPLLYQIRSFLRSFLYNLGT